MQIKDTLGTDRTFLFVELGGLDTHLNQAKEDITLIPDLNDSIDTFVKEKKTLGVWDKVVFVSTSEFS